MAAQRIFIGVDGGGTKTKIQIEDEQGQALGWARSGPANIRSSVEGAWQSINVGIKEALKNTGIELTDKKYEFYAGLGLAGMEVPGAIEHFMSYTHPFKKVVLKSDAYAACLGVHGGQDGAIIIVGTGVIGYQVVGDTVARVGGWGFPHDDMGGGAWFGLEATRLTLQYLDGRIDSTPLLEAVFERFNQSQPKFVTWANMAKPGDFGVLAPLVIEYVEKQDPHALGLMQQSVGYINRLANALAKHSDHPLPLGMLGGIAPFVTPHLSEETKARVVPRKFDATKGALFMVRKEVLGHI